MKTFHSRTPRIISAVQIKETMTIARQGNLIEEGKPGDWLCIDSEGGMWFQDSYAFDVQWSTDIVPVVSPRAKIPGVRHPGMVDTIRKSGWMPGKSKISDAQVLEVVQLYDQGYKVQDIADAYGISDGHVCTIGRRRDPRTLRLLGLDVPKNEHVNGHGRQGKTLPQIAFDVSRP